MNIIYWSDFNCPYSYIGLKRLNDAIDELDLKFTWKFKSYELEFDLKNTPTQSMLSKHMEKFNLSKKDAVKEIEEVNAIARESGIEMHLENVKVVSSRNAHRLVKYIAHRDETLVESLVLRIFEYNFTLNKNIADVNVLACIAEEFGFSGSEIREMLLSDSLNIEVQIDEEDAIFNGIYSIPLYIISINNEQLTIPGAFEKQYFKIALEDMLSGEIKYKTFI